MMRPVPTTLCVVALVNVFLGCPKSEEEENNEPAPAQQPDAGVACDDAACPVGHHCVDDVCTACAPAGDAPTCGEAQLITHHFGNGCTRYECRCPDKDNMLDPELGICVYAYGWTNGFAPVTVHNVPWMQFLPARIGEPVTVEVELINEGAAPFTLKSIRFSADTSPDFRAATTVPMTVPPKEVGMLVLSYTPTASGKDQGWVILDSNASISPTRSFPMVARTEQYTCQASSDCLFGEECTDGTCTQCIMRPPVICQGGIMGFEEFGNHCNFPNCMCPPDFVYNERRCVPTSGLTPCTSDQDCTDGTCTEFCRSHPLCLQAPEHYCVPTP